ncbi:MAG: multidrug ABC transporter permease [Planctomycetes bacterium]|nr:multidrug ABC transporter permease [Planctomycetota bacterium]
MSALAAKSLASRELKSFFRQRSRVMAAVLTPVVLWLMLGSGMGSSFRSEVFRGDFLEYFFPGIVVFSVVFAGMYSTISTIQDRQAGFLQSVLVAPIPRASLVLGKVVGGATIALIQGVVLLVLLPLAGVELSPVGLVLAIGILALISVAMTGMGFVFAWRIDSVQGYHAIMNLILMPMWMLSGAFFPADGASAWVRGVMAVNPLAYGLAALRHALYWGDETLRAGLPAMWLCVGITALCGLLAVWASARAVAKKPF